MHIGVMDIEYDLGKAIINARKRKVSFADAEQALRDPFAITMEDPDAQDEVRFVTLGSDIFGRLLVVVHTPRENRIRLISARKASAGERKYYHAQGV